MTHQFHQPVSSLADPTEPEYRDCTRCGVRLKPKRAMSEHKLCVDCTGLNAFKPPRNGVASGFPPSDPAFEVFVHFPVKPREDQTLLTLEALKIPYVHLWASQHRIEVDWAYNLFNPELSRHWPIVAITSHGEVIDFWEGYDLNRLNALPAKRAAAISPSVPDSQEQAA